MRAALLHNILRSIPFVEMATIVPPPSKRQKLAVAQKDIQHAEDLATPEGLGSVRVQFVDQSNGNATGPVVSVPLKRCYR